MEVLAVVTAPFIPLTFITGFFGMNFFFGAGLDIAQTLQGWTLLGLASLSVVVTTLAMFS